MCAVFKIMIINNIYILKNIGIITCANVYNWWSRINMLIRLTY